MPVPGRLSLLPALLLTLAPALAGCGGGDDDGGRGGRDDRAVGDDVCDVLTVEEVERQTGAEVTRSGGTLGRTTTCTYGAEDGFPAALIQVTSGDPSIEDLLGEARAGDDDETSTEDIEVEGADEAVLLTDTSYGSTTVSVVARADGRGYVVFGGGETPAEEERVSLALLTVLLGGEAEGEFVPEAHPCDALTEAEVRATVRTAVTVERDEGSDDDLPGCSYDGEDISVSLLGFGRGSVSGVVDQTVKIYGEDTEVTEFDADGFDEAFLVIDPSDRSSVSVYLGGESASYALTVRADYAARATDVARGLLRKLV